MSPARTARTARRRWTAALAAAGLVGLLAGGWVAMADDNGGRGAASGQYEPEGPGPEDTPDPALTGQPTPTLPEGDPGTDAPGVDDPNSEDPGTDDGHGGEGSAVDEVPDAALLDTGTLRAITRAEVAEAELPRDCTSAAPAAAGAYAGRAFTVGTDGAITEVVAGYPDDQAAVTAVDPTVEALTGCGFSVVGDPRLGEASTELTRGSTRAVVLAGEGALVVLTASGPPAQPGQWESVVDVALGSACAASPHGCH